jgi:Nuclease-related domain
VDDRAGSRLEELARRRWRSYAVENRRRIVWVALAMAAMFALGAVPTLLVYGPLGRGLMVGALAATLAWFVVIVVAEDSGALRMFQGAMGEQQTAALLRRLERHGWRVVNDVAFDGWNVDHVAIGPAGVFAIETKTTSGRWNFTGRDLDPFADRAVRQAAAGARKIGFLLQEVGDLPVTPLLVVWGRDVVTAPEDRVVGRGVIVLAGYRPRAVLDSVAAGSPVLDSFTIDCAAHHIETFAERRDRHQRARLAADGNEFRRRSAEVVTGHTAPPGPGPGESQRVGDGRRGVRRWRRRGR